MSKLLKKYLSLLIPGVFALGYAPEAQAVVIPVGPQNDVAISTVTSTWGWTECYSETYATPLGNTYNDAIAGCGGDHLMLAAREVGSLNFDVLAAASSADVLLNVGSGSTASHDANGSQWYYAPNSSSWGFAGIGDTISRNSCDVAGSGERDRLCWHTEDSVGGYRSGNNRSLNNSTSFEKVILFADSNTASVPFEFSSTFGLLMIGVGLGIKKGKDCLGKE